MKIDKKKLIELLVTKTGMDATEVEDQLEQLIRRIIDAAERGKALEIKEFGLFYFDEEGELKFDPSKELSTEINFKYVGMEPVELKPPRDAAQKETADATSAKPDVDSDSDETSPETGKDESEEDLSSIFGFDEGGAAGPENDDDEDEDEIELPWGDLTDKGESKGPEDAAEQDYDDEYEDEIPERDEDPFAGLLGDASSKLSATEKGIFGDKEEPSHPLISPGDEAETTDPKKKEPEPTKPESKPEKTKAKPEPKTKPKAEPVSSPKSETVKPAAENKPEKPQPAKPAVAAGKKKASAPAERKVTTGYSSSQNRRDPIMVVLGIVLIFIIVAAAFLLIPGVFSDSEPETQTQPQSQPEATTEVTESSSPGAMEQMPAEDTGSEPVSETETPEQLPPPEPEPEEAVTDNVTADPEAEAAVSSNGYGLRGNLNDEANDGYSIVLHSLRQEANARSIAAKLTADNYRVLVSRRTVNGQNVWRVSVGQFETIANAQEAALSLPSPYNANNFIQRIQTN